MTNSITPDQQVFCQENGKLIDLSAIHTPAEMAENNKNLKELMALLRYSGTEVKNDLTVNPHFKAYLARGVDRHEHNPLGTPPAEKFGRTDFKSVSLEEAGQG